MRKILNFVLIFLILFNKNFTTFAASNCGDWASEAINSAISAEVLADDVNRDYYSPISRVELADLISNTLKRLSHEIPDNSQNFIDIAADSVNAVASLGIMNGYGDGTFLPEAFTSRQEMAKIIITYQAVIENEPLDLPTVFNAPFVDFNSLSQWAKPYVEKAYKDELISGYSDGNFGGLNSVSWQEAIVMIDRVFSFSNIDSSKPTTLCDDFNLNAEFHEGSINITWDKIDNAKIHTLTITEQRLSRYENDIPPNLPLNINFEKETSYTFNANPNKKYSLAISCDNKFCETSVNTPKVVFDDMSTISYNYPKTQEEAELSVTEITVPIWKLVNNAKVPSEATFKVHSEIAHKVILVFEEIYNGTEQFPIKDVNAYSWRGGTTEHNGGTAIDINSNENYCIYNDGTTIGSHWMPYEDPYSITPYGDVVRAFEKYGFTWGGDSWSNPKDYMHFSYLGT